MWFTVFAVFFVALFVMGVVISVVDCDRDSPIMCRPAVDGVDVAVVIVTAKAFLAALSAIVFLPEDPFWFGAAITSFLGFRAVYHLLWAANVSILDFGNWRSLYYDAQLMTMTLFAIGIVYFYLL